MPAIIADFEDFDLNEYSGDFFDFSASTNNPYSGQSLRGGGYPIGITHNSWTVEYDSRYRFYGRTDGTDLFGMYVGDTTGGASSMEGVVLGGDNNFGSVDVAEVTDGAVDYKSGGYSGSSQDYSTWTHFEFVVDDPSGSSPQFTTRILNDDGSINDEVSNGQSNYVGSNYTVMGFVTGADNATYWDNVWSEAAGSSGVAHEVHGSLSTSAAVDGITTRNISNHGSLQSTAVIDGHASNRLSISASPTGSSIVDGKIRIGKSIGGSVTLDGNAVEGAMVYIIDDITGELEGVTTSNADGSFSYVTSSEDGTYHVMCQYQDENGQYHTESYPYINV